MSIADQRSIVVLNTDYQKIIALLARADSAAADALDAEVARAEILDDAEFPSGAVRMGSTVTFKDTDSGAIDTVTLVYPEAADVAQMKISILSPVGSALIGLRIGEMIEWPMPNGKLRHLEVISVTQPTDSNELVD